MNDLSSFLFARPSFTEGAGRLLDFGNTLFEYNRSETGELADYRAIYADCRVIGEELRSGIEAQRRGQQQKVEAKG